MNEETPKQLNSTFASHISIANIPSFGVDVQYESLKSYLDSISGTVNQHAQLIDSIEKDIALKVDVPQLSEIILNISSGLNINDNEFIRIIQGQIGRNQRSENIGNELEVAESKMFNKEVLFSYGLTYLFSKFQTFQSQLDTNADGIQQNVKKLLWREKKKKNKQFHKQQLLEAKNQIEGQIRDLDRKLADSIAYLEDKVIDAEKKTLWRINDCEEILRSKVTERYVDDSVRSMEEKLRRDFGALQLNSEKLDLQFDELRQTIKTLDEQTSDKLKQNKKFSADLENSMNKNFLKKIKYDEEYKTLQDKIDGLVLNLKDLEKKTDYSTIINRQNGRIRQTEEKLTDLENEMLKRMNDMNSRNQGGSGGGNIDPHKICAIENDLARIQSEYNKTKNLLRDLQTEIQNKLDLVDQTILGTAEIKKIVNKDEGMGEYNFEEVKQKLLQAIQPRFDQVYQDIFAIIDDDKVRKIFKELNEFGKRLEVFSENDKKTQRQLKEMDMNQIFKMISTKVEEQDFQLELMSLTKRLDDLENMFMRLQKDADQRFQNQVQLNQSKQDINEQVIVASKRLYPLSGNCISCYKPSQSMAVAKQASSNHGYALGIDGRPYKVDMSQVFNKINCGQDLFIGQEDPRANLQQSVPNLRKATRPSTAKTRTKDLLKTSYIRPDSAKDKNL